MVEYYISSTKYSLQERMTRRGKVYDVVFRIVTLDGQEKQKKLSGYANKTLAKQAYTDFVTSKCELVKNNPIKKKNPQKEDLLVGDLILEYLFSLSNQNKDSSIYDKRGVFGNYIIPYFGKMPISTLTTDVLYRWQDELWTKKNPRTQKHYAYSYLLKIRNRLAAFLSWVESRYNYPNYLVAVKKPKRRIPKAEMQFWTKEEFDKFIAVVDNPIHHAIFMILFYTGRRKGEVLALSPSDITPDGIIFKKTYTRKTIDGSAYNITSTKNEKVGKTPICTPLKKELENYPFESPFAFGGENPIHENTIAHAFERYIKKAGVKRIRVHDLRHSFVSMLIHLGANLIVVADLIGDTLEQVTKTYAHLYEEDKQNIISRII